MNILALDQARKGAWSVFDYDEKKLVDFGGYSFPTYKYTFAETIVKICDIANELIEKYNVQAVFIEDIQLRRNVSSFKKLAQLQGGLVSMFERNEYKYDFVPPSRWQSFCGARGRTSAEIKEKIQEISESTGKKTSKILSIQYIKDKFGIETDDDNIADAICIGHFVCNRVELDACEDKELKEKSDGKKNC